MTYNPKKQTWLSVSLEMHVKNPKPETHYLGERGNIGKNNPVELHDLLYSIVITILRFWTQSVCGDAAEMNSEMEKFCAKIARVKYTVLP